MYQMNSSDNVINSGSDNVSSNRYSSKSRSSNNMLWVQCMTRTDLGGWEDVLTSRLQRADVYWHVLVHGRQPMTRMQHSDPQWLCYYRNVTATVESLHTKLALTQIFEVGYPHATTRLPALLSYFFPSTMWCRIAFWSCFALQTSTLRPAWLPAVPEHMSEKRC